MKTILPSTQRTFDDLVAEALQPPPVRTTTKLIGQPFISPVAKIPTNRTPLSPTIKLR